MQFRNFFTYLLLGALFLLATSVEAQKITTNEIGEKIVVYPDGTWRYFDESLNEDIKAAQDMEVEEGDKSKRQKRKDRKKAEKKKKKANKKKGKSKKSKKGKKKKNVISSAEEERGRKEAMQHAEWAAQIEEQARKKEEDLTFARIFLEEELEESYNSVDVAPEKIDEIETKLAVAKENEKVAKSERKKAAKRADQAERMIDMKKSKRDKLLAKMENEEARTQASALDAIAEPLSDEGMNSAVGAANNEDEGWYKGGDNKSLAKYNKKNDVMHNPPSMDCEYGFDDIDEFTGRRRVELAKQTFFTHTAERLKPYFKNNHHITGEGFLSATTGNVKYLNLKLSILSEHAQREFGLLEKGSMLSLKLINGATVKLLNTKTSSGVLNKVTKTTVYRGQYLISKDHEKTLRRSEVDKVRVVWGTGYEDYEVYELDFFIDQFKCLNKK